MSDRPLLREIKAIAYGLLALFVAGALVTGSVATGPCATAGGLFGPAGACLRAGLVVAVGPIASVLMPIALAVWALRLFGRVSDAAGRAWTILIGGLIVLAPVAIALALGATRETVTTERAGVWGAFTAFYLQNTFGSAGAWILVALGACTLTVLTLAWNPLRLLIGHRTMNAGSVGALAPTTAELLAPSPEEMPAVDETMSSGLADDADEPGGALTGAKRRRSRRDRDGTAQGTGRVVGVAGIAGAMSPPTASDADGDELPSTESLTPAPPRNTDLGRRELDAMGEKLMDALRTFRVDGELVGRTTGPVVTQFEIAPAAGVKVRQIATLANDLALAMRAPSIRIVAPIPGRGAVGVEVPNPTAEIVAFRELIESRDFQGLRAALPIALGKDLEGRPVVADLAKMPHLLIAGATGSGKSVCVNTLVTSLLFRHTPRTLRFLMIDPKMVELSIYDALPHMRHKVVTDNRDAAAVLKWAVIEMQRRYELLAANGARNVQDFNRRVSERAALVEPKQSDVAFEDRTYRSGVLPYIVVVIDELADLMMTVPGEVETPLALLAQKARAIGIHLILATQRPSVNVITGLIKANFPSRIAFRVASQVDSRTIIDGMGAESLLGNGDMLFIPPGKSEPARLQGAYISSEDTDRLMTWYKERREARRARLAAEGLVADERAAEADIVEEMRKREAAADAGTGDGESADVSDRDKLFRESAEVVIQHQQGSTSLLQRRLKVGYGRAARIIDQLHTAGVLGPPDGSRPREVLVGLEDLDAICGPRK
jgi:S-DNA-T family DNA segregation ATPase FtsK/SpoIIIE